MYLKFIIIKQTTYLQMATQAHRQEALYLGITAFVIARDEASIRDQALTAVCLVHLHCPMNDGFPFK